MHRHRDRKKKKKKKKPAVRFVVGFCSLARGIPVAKARCVLLQAVDQLTNVPVHSTY